MSSVTVAGDNNDPFQAISVRSLTFLPKTNIEFPNNNENYKRYNFNNNKSLCSKLATPRKVKTINANGICTSSREELKPKKALLPDRGLVKLTALPEEIQDPLNVYPATQYKRQYHIHMQQRPLQMFTVSSANSHTWMPEMSLPSGNKQNDNSLNSKNYFNRKRPDAVKRKTTFSDILQSTDDIINGYRQSSLTSYQKSQARQYTTMGLTRGQPPVISDNFVSCPPLYDLEKEITRCALAEIRDGLTRSKTQI